MVACVSSSPSLELTSFIAKDGDCILLRCKGTECFTILVDGGREGTLDALRSFFQKATPDERVIDLFVVTHIDADHIEGALEIIRDADIRGMIKQVWFNYPGHEIREAEAVELSIGQGNAFVDELLEHKLPWNVLVGNGNAVTWTSDGSNAFQVAAGTRITVLAPDESSFAKLRKAWPIDEKDNKTIEDRADVVAMGSEGPPDVADLGQTQHKRDRSVINGSSIAMFVEHEKWRILLSADAHPETLTSSLSKEYGLPVTVDFATVPHHGSSCNTSLEFANSVHAKRWLISTDGSKHAHPSREAISRIVLAASKGGRESTLVFNGDHAEAKVWDDDALKDEFGFETEYRANGKLWVTVNLA